MKKRAFSFRLFADTFRQLRIVGMTATIILSLFAAIIPIGEYISSYKYIIVENGVQEVIYNTNVVSSLNIQPLVILTYILVAPLLVVLAFSFLNKRNASDFYHAIPETRTCIFITLFSACMAWVTIVLLSSTAVSLITTAILHKYFIVNYSTVFISMFTIFSASLLVAAAVAAAMTITGTLFNNVFVSALILFVPRIFIFIIHGFVTDSIPFLVSNMSDNWFLSPTINIAFGTISGVLYGNYPEMIYSIPSGIYTLALGLLIGAAALWGFNRRKSESAGNAAASKRLSAIYRITLASALSLIPCVYIFNISLNDYGWNNEQLFLLLVIYLVIILAYAIYELISSKKFAAVLRSLPGLLFVAAANGLILLVMFGYNSHLVNFAPSVNETTSINLINRQSIYSDERNYILDRAEKTNITDKKAIQIVSESLAKGVELYNRDRSEFNKYYYQSKDGQMMIFRINTGTRSEVRELLLSQEDYNYIIEVLENNEDYRKIFYDLPQKNVGLKIWASGIASADLTEYEDEIYKLYLEDMKEIPLQEQINNVSQSAEDAVGYMELEFSHGLRSYSMELSITRSHKRTVNYINKLVYDTYADQQKLIISMMSGKTSVSLNGGYLYMYPENVVNAEGDFAYEINLYDDEEKGKYDLEALELWADYLETCPDRAPTVSDAYIDVTIDIPPEELLSDIDNAKDIMDKEYKSIFARFTLPSNQLPEHLEAYAAFQSEDK